MAMIAMVDTVDTPATAATASATATATKANRFMDKIQNTRLVMDQPQYGPLQLTDMDMDTDHTEQRVINYSIIQIRV